MKAILVSTALFCIGTVISLSIPQEQHVHCTRTTCPQYVVLSRFLNIELRCYQPSIWISISGRGKLYRESHDLPLWKLEQFINGNNSKKIDVRIGAVSTHLFDEGRGSYSAEYFVPSYFRDEMPRPVDKDVRVIFRRSFCAYVYGFPGWFVSYSVIPARRTRTRQLIANQFGLKNYYPDFFFYAAYRSGLQFIPQYNEIWYVLKFEETDENNETRPTVNLGKRQTQSIDTVVNGKAASSFVL
eukprot:gene14261-15748_t